MLIAVDFALAIYLLRDGLHDHLADHVVSAHQGFSELRRDGLLRHADALAAAISQDFGQRSIDETRLAELFPALQGIAYAQRHLRRWMRAQGRGLSPWFWPARAEVQAQPLGVVGIIVPWNYPLYLAIGPLTDALAGAVKLAERAVADDGEKSVRQAATALYNCTTAIAMAWEARKTGSNERLRLSQLVVAHRVLPWDPLNEGGVPAERGRRS